MKLEIHNSPYEIKAFNFYHSSVDITLMLKNKIDASKLTESHKNLILKYKSNLQEWLTKKVDIDAYNKFYRDLTAITKIERKLNALNVVIATIEPFKELGFKYVATDENKALLKSICNKISLPIIDNDFKMLEQCYKAKKGIENDLKRLKKKLQKEGGVDFDFIDQFMTVKKIEQYQGGSMDITLAEWAILYRNAVETNRRNESKK